MLMHITTEIVDLAKDLTLIGAAIWATIRFRKERTYEAALEIGFQSSTISDSSLSIAFLEVTLTNRGKLKLQARSVPKGGYAYKDADERVLYGGDLKVKRLSSMPASAEVHLDWFSSKGLKDICEVNLLTEYVSPQEGDKVKFWMEPGEAYHLGVPLHLAPGAYLAKVTFVGADEPEDFWSRIVAFEVKEQAGV